MANYYTKYTSSFVDDDANEFEVNLRKVIIPNINYQLLNQNFETNTDWYNYEAFGGIFWIITGNSAQVILPAFTAGAFLKQDLPFSNSLVQAVTMFVDYTVTNITAGAGDTRIIVMFASGDTIITSRVFDDTTGSGSFSLNESFNLPIGVDGILIQANALFGSGHQINMTEFRMSNIIVPQGISGDSSTISIGTLSPVRINYIGGREESNTSPIKISECEFQFYKSEEDDYDDLFESNYRDWQIQIKKNGNNYWLGWMQPDRLTGRWLSEQYVISLKAVDGLIDLKNQLFPEDQINNGYEKVIKHFKSCLSLTELELPIESQVNLTEVNFSDNNTLENAFVTSRRFRTLKDGRSTPLKAFIGLEYLLKWMNATIFQDNGKWRIQQRNEIESILYEYDYHTLSVDSVTTDYSRLISVDDSNGKPLFESDQLSKQKPTSYIDLTHRNIYEGDPLINYTFEALTGLTNGGYQDSWDTFDIVGNRLRTVVSNSVAMSETSFITSEFFLEKLSTGDTLIVSVENLVQAYPKFHSSATGTTYTLPNIEISISGESSGIYFTSVLATQLFGWKKLEFEAPVNATESVVLIVNCVPVTPVEDIILFWDNLIANVKYSNSAIFDQYFQITNTGNTTFIDNYEYDIHFADADFVNQKQTGVIKYSSTGLTLSWSNYGESENFKIAVLTGYNRLRLRSKFTDYITFTLLSNTIQYHNILFVKNKKFEIIGYSYDLKNSIIELELSEYPENEVGITYQQFALDTVDGN